MIGIIGAMSAEVDKLKLMLENKQSEMISSVEYISGTLNGHKVVVAKCGIGKVFAAICAQTMILRYSPDIIINTGVAGGVAPSLKIGDIVTARDTVQYDMDTTAFGDPLGMISGLNIVHVNCIGNVADDICECARSLGINAPAGTVVSADRFVSDKETKKMLLDKFGALACDMESGSINHVCYVNNVPCAVVRAISDSADGSSIGDYTAFLEKAADNAVSVVLKYTETH